MDAVGWMKLCCLSVLRLSPAIRKHQNEELGSADTGKHNSHLTGSKKKAKSVIMQHMDVQKPHKGFKNNGKVLFVEI